MGKPGLVFSFFNRAARDTNEAAALLVYDEKKKFWAHLAEGACTEGAREGAPAKRTPWEML